MKIIERGKGLIEPSIEEITNSVNKIIGSPSMEGALDGNIIYTTVGEEKPKSANNMKIGTLTMVHEGLHFYEFSMLDWGKKSMSEERKRIIRTAFKYAGVEFGVIGVGITTLFRGIKNKVKKSLAETDERPKEEPKEDPLIYVIPVINIIGTEIVSIPAEKIRLPEIEGLKILAEDSNGSRSTYWIGVGRYEDEDLKDFGFPFDNMQDFSDRLFELRYEEELKLYELEKRK
jgi:hypothetical protein|tara:strand:+ start:79 stop:771 length:693 start_codon:yes stop_codon:yes gene_type:complete